LYEPYTCGFSSLDILVVVGLVVFSLVYRLSRLALAFETFGVMDDTTVVLLGWGAYLYLYVLYMYGI
jgi:hypothetical protein